MVLLVQVKLTNSGILSNKRKLLEGHQKAHKANKKVKGKQRNQATLGSGSRNQLTILYSILPHG